MADNQTENLDYLDANYSLLDGPFDQQYYIFDKLYIRIIFYFLYTTVFCLCFFGNLLVILVVTRSGRLRGPTNFFLANLAFADICVAVFCVYQNLLIYLVDSWVLGEFMCKMNFFVQTLSNSASIVILVVICVERYLAILHPIRSKQILTTMKLRIVMILVWCMCILYSAPKFYWGNTVNNNFREERPETVCVLNRQKYDSRVLDIIHFVLLYLIPLGIITILYTRIAVCLWNSSQTFKLQLSTSTNVNYYEPVCIRNSRRDRVENGETSNGFLRYPSNGTYQNANLAQKLKSRRGVIKMLIILVCTFALCNLPFHARKMWQDWSPNYKGHTNFSALLTPLTFLATYFNSAVNPLLYAFLSKNFRGGMREFLFWWEKRPKGRSNLTNDRRFVRSTLKTEVEIPMENQDQNHFTHDI